MLNNRLKIISLYLKFQSFKSKLHFKKHFAMVIPATIAYQFLFFLRWIIYRIFSILYSMALLLINRQKIWGIKHYCLRAFASLNFNFRRLLLFMTNEARRYDWVCLCKSTEHPIVKICHNAHLCLYFVSNGCLKTSNFPT